MMDEICHLCKQPGQVFETNEAGIWACEKCRPLNPEVSFSEKPEAISFQTDSRNHVRNHTAEKKFACMYCSKAFSQSNNLRAHLRIHTNERPYKCSQCDKAFTQITNLNNHIRLHTGEKPFVCGAPGCDKAFAQVTNLNQHRKSHSKLDQFIYTPRVFSCRPCGLVFTNSREQTFHRRSVHGNSRSININPKGIFSCSLCNEYFPTKQDLDKHGAMHMQSQFSAASKPLVTCPLRSCGMIVKGSMDTHIASFHGEEKQTLKCPFKRCMRYFSTTDRRNLHITSDHFGSGPTKQLNRASVNRLEFVSVNDIHFGSNNGDHNQKLDNNVRNYSSKKYKQSSQYLSEVPIECEVIMGDSSKR